MDSVQLKSSARETRCSWNFSVLLVLPLTLFQGLPQSLGADLRVSQGTYGERRGQGNPIGQLKVLAVVELFSQILSHELLIADTPVELSCFEWLSRQHEIYV